MLTPILALILFGCSSDDPPIVSTTAGVMVTETTAGTAGTTAGTTTGSTAGSILDVGPELLEPETTITAELAGTEYQLYKLDSGSNISLVTNSGNVDILVVDEVEDIDFSNIDFEDFDFNAVFGNDKNLCWSAWYTEEDVCTATAEDGDVYALVLAFEDSNYSISSTAECSVQNINRWVKRNMLDYYIYASEVPNVNSDEYSDPSDLVDALRFESLDPFSNIQDASDQISLAEEGVDFGFGFDWRRDANGDLRMLYVFDDGPFGRAGIKRGDIAVSINGELLGDMSEARFYELYGTEENPVLANWQFIDGETGDTKTVSVAQNEFRVNTVLESGVYTNPDFSGAVGYIAFKQFIQPSVEELDFVIQSFAIDGVTELVLDLRYNGGGSARVKARVASQIAGSIVENQLQSREKHNEKYSAYDFEAYFPAASPSLDLNRMVVLTTHQTASASERLINELRPYFEVVTMGSKTRGKAFGSSGREYCGKMLNAMQLQGVNANDVSVAGGIIADCYAEDDTSNDFGLGEGMFGSAVDYLVNGTCEVAPMTIATRSRGNEAPRPTETIMLDSFSE